MTDTNTNEMNEANVMADFQELFGDMDDLSNDLLALAESNDALELLRKDKKEGGVKFNLRQALEFAGYIIPVTYVFGIAPGRLEVVDTDTLKTRKVSVSKVEGFNEFITHAEMRLEAVKAFIDSTGAFTCKTVNKSTNGGFFEAPVSTKMQPNGEYRINRDNPLNFRRTLVGLVEITGYVLAQPITACEVLQALDVEKMEKISNNTRFSSGQNSVRGKLYAGGMQRHPLNAIVAMCKQNTEVPALSCLISVDTGNGKLTPAKSYNFKGVKQVKQTIKVMPSVLDVAEWYNEA